MAEKMNNDKDLRHSRPGAGVSSGGAGQAGHRRVRARKLLISNKFVFGEMNFLAVRSRRWAHH